MKNLHGRNAIIIGASKGAGTHIAATLVREGVHVALMAPLLLMRMVLPVMIEHGYGHIVNASSVSGKRGLPYEATYSASKAAVVEWSNALRIELEGAGVGISGVNP